MIVETLIGMAGFLVGFLFVRAMMRAAWRRGYRAALEDVFRLNLPNDEQTRWSPRTNEIANQLLEELGTGRVERDAYGKQRSG